MGSTLAFDNMITLKELDIKIERGSFVCVIGDVAAGKSSLLNAIIGDMLYLPTELKKKYS